MEVTCLSCDRNFSVDAQRARGVLAARCVCGAQISLGSSPQGGAQVGQKLGKYVLINRIAMGGMGEIYYGKKAGIEGFEREVALKKMLPYMSADRNFIEMLIKEAKLTVLLNHPNIVQVFDLDKEGQEYYIAMEYIEGINVGNLLDKCRHAKIQLPWQVAVHIVLQVLRGLAYAHGLIGPDGEPMHILHRDITPQNILLTRDAWVKITDFGIAKARNEISNTSTGLIKGKLGYITPEQLDGKEADQRIDIFCAGIILWESLMCRRLFKGDTEIETFRLIAEARIPPLSSNRDDVPSEVEAALAKGLARDRDQRYSTADDFYNALNQSLFPQNADDCLAATKAFLADHPEFFHEVDEHKTPSGLSDCETVPLENKLRLVDIAELSSIPEPSSPETKTPVAKTSKRWLALVSIVLLGGLAAWLMGDGRDLLPKASFPKNPSPDSSVSPGSSLSQEEVQLAVNGEKLRLLKCYRNAETGFRKLRDLGADLTIASTGGVAQAVLIPEQQNKQGQCIKNVLQRMQFRTHELPQVLRKVSLPSPAENSTAPAKSAPTRSSKAAKALTAGEIQGVVRKNSTAIARCLKNADLQGTPAKVDATITIEMGGRVGEVNIVPKLPDTKAQKCLQRTLSTMRFRRHPNKNFQVTVPLRISVQGS